MAALFVWSGVTSEDHVSENGEDTFLTLKLLLRKAVTLQGLEVLLLLLRCAFAAQGPEEVAGSKCGCDIHDVNM